MNILVFSSLFPSSVRPHAGLFVKERAKRVTGFAHIKVISPVPWFPLQSLLRLFFPDYRPMPSKIEYVDGLEVYYPRFLSFPSIGRRFDGFFMRVFSERCIRKLNKTFHIDAIDSHFTYPDGFAATQIAKALDVPSSITLRGTEKKHLESPKLRSKVQTAWYKASKLITVSTSLKELAIANGAQADKITVIGNGIDTEKFFPQDKSESKTKLDIAPLTKVLITVGGLVPRKGFHRVLEILPAVIDVYPDLVYLIVGGATAEGNNEADLKRQVEELDISKNVRFLGPKPASELTNYLSAADLFVLPTANEGWANVFLESLSCATPVVATDVGGNKEVICNDDLGFIIPFGDAEALKLATLKALEKDWNGNKLIQYAADNHWDKRVTALKCVFDSALKTKILENKVGVI
ncbi:MAG: teichuronic acid biosynthesis glycosyltransferase TuaC [Glaciecola sp.]